MTRTAKTSKALAKLAADYLNLTVDDVQYLYDTSPAVFAKNIRKLAASVLRQVEGDGK